MKAQIVICQTSEQVVATFFGNGKTHDYKLFQMSEVKFGESVKVRVDLGYWGLQTEMANVLLPLKNSKRHRLTKAEK